LLNLPLAPGAEEVQLLTFILAVAVSSLAQSSPSPSDACAAHGTSLWVETRSHRLRLCEGGRTLADFPVALGERGIGKRLRGDRRTPLGVYPLGSPRPSASFGTFIPIGYPTPWQKRMGFTGSAVGLHGPPRDLADAGASNVASDWTWGCVALASDAEIARVAAWVRASPSVRLLIT
jgi:L,D-peptidoglycan transpeptidase YkuD (ErfK/YbiS/YcfS/YnhG family)